MIAPRYSEKLSYVGKVKVLDKFRPVDLQTVKEVASESARKVGSL